MFIRLKNLFIQEKGIGFRIIILIVIALGSVWISRFQKTLALRLEEVKAQKQLVLKISQMEQQVQSYEGLGKVELEELERTAMDDFVLRGVFYQDNEHQALIGNKIYRKGDACGKFDNSW